MKRRTFNKPIAKAEKWKRTYRDIVYDSIIEAKRASELDLLVRGGDITEWFRQFKVPLGRDFETRVDFLCFKWLESVCHNEAWEIWAEEVKHKRFDTKEFRRIRKLWTRYGPFRLKILWWTGSTWDIEWLDAGTETGHGM